MILGEPTLEAILEYLEAEGCPYCREVPTEIQVNSPDDIQLSCRHDIDATKWIDIGFEFPGDERG